MAKRIAADGDLSCGFPVHSLPSPAMDPSEELNELREHAEGGREKSLAGVSLTMSVLAVLLAAVSLLGHRAHTEEVILQTKVTNQWAYYQAKNMRRQSYELFQDMISISNAKDSPTADKLKEKYGKEIERYREEQKEIDAEARKLEQETGAERRRADRFDLGEGFLEVALVITSITLLSGRKVYWYAGSLVGILG